MRRPLVGIVSSVPLGVGGVEEHVWQLIRTGQQFDFAVICAGDEAFFTRCRALRAGVHTYAWRGGSAYDFVAALRLRSILKQAGVNLVHTHDLRSMILGAIAARTLGLPLINTVHMPRAYTARAEGASGLKVWVCAWVEGMIGRSPLADYTIYVSQTLFDEAQRRRAVRPGRALVIPNGVDVSRYEPKKRRPDASIQPSGGVTLAFVGRLTKQKGLDLLLRALYYVAAELPKVGFRLLLVGDGPDRPVLEALARDLGLADKICFLGFRDDVPDILARSDIFVLPSRYEGMPYALLEAMAASLPVIATDVGENAALLEGAGIVVPPEDVLALSQALKALILDPLLRSELGSKAYDRARMFDSSEMAGRVIAVYRECLERRGR
ncbi:MAG: glycosyltransferase family 4 protein [Moorellales bacterium]